MTFVALLMAFGQAAAKNDPMQYDIMAAGSGAQGTYLVKVYVYSSSKKVTDNAIKRAAVHGVIFRGVAGGNGAPTQRPLASADVEIQKADYFEMFFDEKSGIYNRFADIVPGSYERSKAPKGYKVGAILQVTKDELRQELEKAGVIRSLSSGF